MTQSSQMEIEFKAAKEAALKQTEEYISSLFAEGQETVPFRFDGFSLWNKSTSGGAEELWSYLQEQELHTDPWNRSVWRLTKEQALKIALEVKLWHADWEYEIACRLYSGNPMKYYNAYHLDFSPATGTEHTIKAGGAKGRDDAWQWH